jgi:hypothetical protein
MQKPVAIFISSLYVIFILSSNSVNLAYSQSNLATPLPNMGQNRPVSNIHDPTLFIVLNDNTGQVQNGDFILSIVNNGIITQTPTFPPNINVQLNSGTYSVEVSRAATAPNRFSVSRSPDCSSATAGEIGDQSRTCTLTVNFGSLTPERQAFDVSGGGVTSRSGLAENDTQHLIPERQGSIVVERRDELFQSCKAATVTNGNTDVNGAFNSIIPSSALYTIEGTANIGKIANTLKSGGPITFQFQGDLIAADNVQLSTSNPVLTGSIQSGEDPFPIKQTPFKTSKITTDCKFYTLVKPNAQDNIGKFAPNGQEKIKTIGEIKKNNKNVPVKSPPIKPFVLLGGEKLRSSTFINTLAVNPPFRACGPVVDDVPGGQVARYTIKGTPQLSSISFSGTHTLSLRIYVDLVPVADDLARIVNTNNVVAKVVLVADPGKSNAKVINIPATEISTDCLGVGFSTNPVVKFPQNN